VITERESGGHERLSASTPSLPSSPIRHLANILKKYNLCRVLKIQHSAKLLKKEKKPLPSARDPALGKVYKKPKKKVCRVLSRTALGKRNFPAKSKNSLQKMILMYTFNKKSTISCIIICISD